MEIYDIAKDKDVKEIKLSGNKEYLQDMFNKRVYWIYIDKYAEQTEDLDSEFGDWLSYADEDEKWECTIEDTTYVFTLETVEYRCEVTCVYYVDAVDEEQAYNLAEEEFYCYSIDCIEVEEN